MVRVHGMKVICLTTGDLTDARKRSMKCGRNKVYREKSAEVIVAIGNEPWIDTMEVSQDSEGLNPVVESKWMLPIELDNQMLERGSLL